MATRAYAKQQRIAPRKARLVADLIRNKNADQAIQILAITNKKAAHLFTKVVNAAIANAVNNDGCVRENLFVTASFVDEGPTMKRFLPRARGSASRLNKRTSHITIIVSEDAKDFNVKTPNNKHKKRNAINAEQGDK